MTKVTYTGLLGDFQYLTDAYAVGAFNVQSPTGTTATYVDGINDGKVVFGGKDMVFDGDTPLSGKVTSVTFENSDGDDYVVMTRGNFKLTQLVGILTDDGVTALVKKLFAGNDTFKGSETSEPMYGYGGKDKLIGGVGSDLLDGGKGNDHVTGGQGADYFVFYKGAGKDVITDFDANGGPDKQDFLYLNADLDYTVRTVHNGIVVDFGKDEVTLLGVTQHDFNPSDIQIANF